MGLIIWIKIINRYKEILISFHINIQKFRRKNFLDMFCEKRDLFWNSKIGGLKIWWGLFPEI